MSNGISKRNFQIADIWRDKEMRGILTQIIAGMLLFAFLAWIVTNTITNLESLGIEPSFDFLQEPAGYEINQKPIDYSSTDRHLDAMYIGLINTGIVAFLGIIFATIIGFLAGVARLSSNWLLSRIVYVYVEATRNVPLLLQILLWYQILTHTLPHPKQALNPVTGFFMSNRGITFPNPHFEAAFIAVVIAFFAAIVAAVLFARYAKKVQEETGKIYPVILINLGLIILVPAVVFLLAGMPITFTWPVMGKFNLKGGLTIIPELLALLFALSIYTGSFISENVRSGILAVSHGQTEAARSLGLKGSWTMRLVVLPQALRVVIPPLISQYLNLTKNSSLALAIGYMDVVATIGGITLNQTGRALECMAIVLSIYLIISLSISTFMNWYNNKIKLVER